jgi:hypothetical protein
MFWFGIFTQRNGGRALFREIKIQIKVWLWSMFKIILKPDLPISPLYFSLINRVLYFFWETKKILTPLIFFYLDGNHVVSNFWFVFSIVLVLYSGCVNFIPQSFIIISHDNITLLCYFLKKNQETTTRLDLIKWMCKKVLYW